MDVFTALSDPVRRALLVRLAEESCRVVDLAADHEISRPAISRHLRVLSEAGLVAADDHGRERHYRLIRTPLRQVADLLTALAPRPPITAGDLDALATEVHRTSRDRRRSAHRGHTEPNPSHRQEDIA
ncbi:ArsR/SmtB family transcription factor [Propionibacteriaceae bacterium Y1685]|uniref:ArsR/SmtB family transcription factor n=1 Tax=Microlunatus sp. Y1700 TaxID=3418487 RepID=UPI003B80E9E4